MKTWEQIIEEAPNVMTAEMFNKNIRENVPALEAPIADDVQRLTDERDEARYNARVLASAWETDSRPPADVVTAALAYPVRT